MWKNNFLRYGFIGMILVFSSCATYKNEKFGRVYNIPDVKLRNLLKKNEIEYDKIYLKKANISIQSNKDKKSFKGSIIIKKDSAIVVSILAPMGIELVRALFNQDSIFIMDKHNKIVLTSDYSYFEREFGVDFNYSTIQAILTNSLFIYPVKDEFYEDLKKYKHSVTDSCYSFLSISNKKIERKTKRNSNDLVIHEIHIHPDIFRIFSVYIKDFQNNQTFNVTYENFIKYEDVLFPEIINLKGRQGNSTIDIKIKINSVEINEGGSLYFKVPDKFEYKNL